jgi:hypothetical protein
MGTAFVSKPRALGWLRRLVAAQGGQSGKMFATCKTGEGDGCLSTSEKSF